VSAKFFAALTKLNEAAGDVGRASRAEEREFIVKALQSMQFKQGAREAEWTRHIIAKIETLPKA
jgi:hypothetical protein